MFPRVEAAANVGVYGTIEPIQRIFGVGEGLLNTQTIEQIVIKFLGKYLGSCVFNLLGGLYGNHKRYCDVRVEKCLSD